MRLCVIDNGYNSVRSIRARVLDEVAWSAIKGMEGYYIDVLGDFCVMDGDMVVTKEKKKRVATII